MYIHTENLKKTKNKHGMITHLKPVCDELLYFIFLQHKKG